MDGSFMPVVPDSLMVDPGDVATARSLGNGRVEVTIIKAGTAQLTASYGGLTATAEIVGLAVVDVDLTVKLAGTADWQGIGLSGGKVRGVAGVFLHAGRRERCYLRLTNTSSAPGVVRLRGQQVTGITTTYLAGEDVTAQVLHLQGWKTPKIAPGESLVVELSLAIPSDYPAGNKRQIKVWLLPAEASSSLDTVAVQMTSGPPL
jgi:hypothetical protein